MEVSREQPYVSKMNLSIFKALILTISLLWVIESMQKRSSCGRIL